MMNVSRLALLIVFVTPSLLRSAKLPFTVQATENVSAAFPGAPQVEASSFAQWKGRWVFIGGRIAGYHAMGGEAVDFSRADANHDVWVVDTTVKPAHTYHVPVNLLPSKLAALKDEWISTGQLSYQDGPSLYIAGGYGQDSTGHWVTYPLISKIDLPKLIDGVMHARLPPDSIAFTQSSLVQSAGGDLIKLADNNFYVVMGHVFTGNYTAFEGQGEQNRAPVSQVYLNEIRKLKITSQAAGALAVTLVDRQRDDIEFHRRDLNVAKILSPRGLGLAAYGGVFTPNTQLSYSKPVYWFLGSAPTIDRSFNQKINAYKCAKLLLYDKAESTMYTTFLGGISRFAWDSAGEKFTENPREGSKSSGNYLDGLQWSDQVSTIANHFNAQRMDTFEFVDPDSLPAYLGTNAFFIPAPGLALASEDSDILDFAAFRGGKTFVGYLYGGIHAFPFQFPYTKTSSPYNAGTVPTKPSEFIVKVYVTPGQGLAGEGSSR